MQNTQLSQACRERKLLIAKNAYVATLSYMGTLPNLPTLSERIEWAREKAGLTQAQMAARFDKEKTTGHRWLKKPERLRLELITQLAELFRVPPPWLAYGETRSTYGGNGGADGSVLDFLESGRCEPVRSLEIPHIRRVADGFAGRPENEVFEALETHLVGMRGRSPAPPSGFPSPADELEHARQKAAAGDGARAKPRPRRRR